MQQVRETRKELIECYVRAAWILKIRLMSARRQLWAPQASLIHLESALLQMRKVCEGITKMCVIASEIQTETFDQKLRKDYKVGAVFKLLTAKDALHFPDHARLTKQEGVQEPAIWKLERTASTQNEIDRVAKIHSRCGNALHEFHPVTDWPSSTDAAIQGLSAHYNGVRGDHQWLWNRFWQHAITLRKQLFFVNLGDDTRASMPRVIKEDGLIEGDLNVEFDADYLADFAGSLDWGSLEHPGENGH